MRLKLDRLSLITCLSRRPVFRINEMQQLGPSPLYHRDRSSTSCLSLSLPGDKTEMHDNNFRGEKVRGKGVDKN